VETVENRPDPAPELPPEPLYSRQTHKPGPLRDHSALTCAFRHIRPSWHNYIQYVDLAARNGDTAMARYRACYESLTPRDRLGHWPEQICELANITPGELVGAVCRALWESKAAESSMVSAIAHPELLERTAKLANGKESFRDRELFFRMTGSVPDKKGASINIFNNPTAHAGSVKLVDGEINGTRLKTMDEEVIEMTRQLDRSARLPFLNGDGDDDVPQ
jgi:hypothetical protein